MMWLRYVIIGFFSLTALSLMAFQTIEIFEAVVSNIHYYFGNKS